MSTPVIQLDLDLAWRRTKNDVQIGRVFVHSPLEIQLIEADLKPWLDRLEKKIRDGYQPDSAFVTDIPKGNGAVRPGAMLTLEDRVVYAGLVGEMLPKINAGLSWSQGKVDFSYRLSEVPRRVDWFTNAFNGWTAFRKASIAKIDGGAKNVVVTDITGFYENIDLQTLFSDLRALGCPVDVANLLSRCLNRWCVLPGRGLPQGLSASDILAKVYLNPVDQGMIDDGLDFVRYVDDIRIFCQNLPEGKVSLMRLAQLLRRRGLNLQSAKTTIQSAADARNKIEGVNPLINGVHKKYHKELQEFIRDEFPSIPVPLFQQTTGNDAPIEVLREVFRDHILKDKNLNKTLLHFLLKRLGEQKDKIALDFCLTLIIQHPQETDPALQYLGTTSEFPKIFKAIHSFLISQENIYDYQIYQIFRWLTSLHTKPSEDLISDARQYAFDNAKPSYLRSVCKLVLQEYGGVADLERLEGSYAHAHNEYEKAEVLVNIKRMESGRRNSFYGRVSADGFLCERACQLVKTNRL